MFKKTLLMAAAFVGLSLLPAEAQLNCAWQIQEQIDCNRVQSSNARTAYTLARRYYSQAKREARRGTEPNLYEYMINYSRECEQQDAATLHVQPGLDLPQGGDEQVCTQEPIGPCLENEDTLSYLKCMQNYLRAEVRNLRSQSRDLRSQLRDALRNGCQGN